MSKYQYMYVELAEVMKNPEEYIIPLCMPACRALWDKNIETFMVSNDDDEGLYVLLVNVSDENMKIFREMQKEDPRFIFNGFRNTIGIAVQGHDLNAMHELEALTGVFQMQDTMRFKSKEEFLEEYKCTGGEYHIEEDGRIRRLKNPDLENATLEEALEKTGMKNLYVPSEGRVYEDPVYLSWHERYEQALNDDMREKISEITQKKDNVNDEIAHLRDTFLNFEREYVQEVLKNEEMRDLISEVNNAPSEQLFVLAQDIVDKVEMGIIPEEQMEMTERKLIVLLAAIQDRVLIKDLVLTSRGRTR